MSNFTFKHYKDTLQLALNKKYKFLKCEQYNLIKKHEKVIILRHDIDFSLENALKFANIENKLGIPSTYFIRLHSKYYNPLEYNSYNIIKSIQDLGHEIGFHQEPDFSSLFPNPNEYLKQEIKSFNLLFQTQIKGVSTHEPARRGIQITPQNISEFNLEYESYFPIFTQQMKYISDSGARWREGCMSEWINQEKSKLYINTHPFWWFENSPLENY
jgi:hypothetical protein|tara:strand:- start:10092 stop:10736 length:645 start_codon:yes stop_codon:yes gene_type:complete